MKKAASQIIRDIKTADESMANQFALLLKRHSIPLPAEGAFTVLSIGCGLQPIELEVIAREHKQAELIGIDISQSDIEDFEENRKGAYSERIKTMVADASKPDAYTNIDPESVKLVFFRHPVVFHDTYQTLIDIFQLVLAKFRQAQIFVSCHYPHEMAILNYVLQTDPLLPCRVLKTAGTLIAENLTCTTPQDPFSFVFSAATTQINPLHHQRIIDEFNMIKTKLVQLESKSGPAKKNFIKDKYTSLKTLDTKGAPLQIAKLVKFSDIVSAISTGNEVQRERLCELNSPLLKKLTSKLLDTCNHEPELLKPQTAKVLSEIEAPEFVLQDRKRIMEKCAPQEMLLHFEPIIMLTVPTYKKLKLKPSDEYVSVNTIKDLNGRPQNVILIRCVSCYIPLKVEGAGPDLRLVANKAQSLGKQESTDLKAVYPNGIFYRNAVGQITFLTEKIPTPPEALVKKAKFKALSFTQKVKVTKHAHENSYYCALFFPSPKQTNEFLQGFKSSNFESAKDKSIIALVQYLDCLKRHLRDCQEDLVKPFLTLISLLRRDCQNATNFHVLLLEWACLRQFKNEHELQRLYNDRLSCLPLQDYPEFESLDSLKQAFSAWFYKADFPDLITEAMLDEFPGLSLKTLVDDSYQDLLPAEIWQYIFSFTNRRSIQAGRCVNTFFRANLQNKAMAIRIIESDAKYLPNITNAELLDSVCKNGIAKHHRARAGIAIRPFTNNHIEKQTDYKFYQISIAAKWFNPDTEFTEFGVDSTGLLRVSPEGDITFHGYNDVNKGILDNVLQHHKPEKFLNHPNPTEWRR